MSTADVDAYLQALPEPKRATLEEMRRRILAIIPDATQHIAWNMPAFKLNGKYVAGFCAFKHHVSYFPHSGSVLEAMAPELEKYTWSKGTLQFAVDKPLPKALIKRLIAVRRQQAGV